MEISAIITDGRQMFLSNGMWAELDIANCPPKIAAGPGKGADDSVRPSASTNCEMPELATRNMGMLYSRALM